LLKKKYQNLYDGRNSRGVVKEENMKK
jgi:hypothetical protein